MGQQLSQDEQNFFCTATTCVMNVEKSSSQMEWKNQILQECVDMQDYCIWAKELIKVISNLPAQPIYQFTKAVLDFDKEFRMEQTGNQANRSQSYRNSLNNHSQLFLKEDQEEEEKIGNDLKTIQHMIKQSCLNDDDVFNQMSKNKNPVRESIMSGRSSSFSPSYIHYEKGPLQQQDAFTLDELDQLRNQITYYIKLTGIISEQIKTQTHQLSQIREKCIDSLSKNFNQCDPKDLQKLITEIQQFARVYVASLQIYYSLDVLCENKKYAALVNQENLINFSVHLLLENPQLNSVLYGTIKESEKNNIQILENEFKSKGDVTPETMNVPIKLRLDQSTVNYINNQNGSQISYREHIPYEKVIKIMKKMSKALSPTSKYKSLMKLSESIMICIQRFYSEYGAQFTDLVESDDMMNILTYILYKSGANDITVHEQMIEKFSTNKLLTSTTGYYLIALRAIVDEIINKEKKKIQ